MLINLYFCFRIPWMGAYCLFSTNPSAFTSFNFLLWTTPMSFNKISRETAFTLWSICAKHHVTKQNQNSSRNQVSAILKLSGYILFWEHGLHSLWTPASRWWGVKNILMITLAEFQFPIIEGQLALEVYFTLRHISNRSLTLFAHQICDRK